MQQIVPWKEYWNTLLSMDKIFNADIYIYPKYLYRSGTLLLYYRYILTGYLGLP